MNPYFGKDGLQFVFLFVQRMFSMLTGQLSFAELAPDEVQIGALSLVALSTALVGTFLVLKKMTMLANALSHTILPGLVIAYLFSFSLTQGAEIYNLDMKTLLIASLATGILTVASTQFLSRVFKLQEDASIGLVSTTMVALGVVLVTVFTRNTHLGIEAIMGNVDALHINDLKLVFYVACINIALISLFFKEFKIVAFDSLFAKTRGFSPTLWNYLLMLLTAMSVIGAFRAVGILLVLALLVGPVLTARLFTHRLGKVILLAMIIGIVASFMSVALSRHCLSVYHVPLSTSGMLATLLGLIYALCLLFKKEKSLYTQTT